MLKLNGDKSDIMVLNGPRPLRIQLPSITICDESVSKSDSTTLLGVEVDTTLSLKNHVKKTTKNVVSTSCIIYSKSEDFY